MRFLQAVKFLTYKARLAGKGKVKIGNNFWMDKNVYIMARGAEISIGDSCAIRRYSTIFANAGSKIQIGKGVFFNHNCSVYSRQSILIEDNCIFGPNVCIYDHNHVFDFDGAKPNEYKTAAVHIKKNCWIGANAVVLKGVTIGESSVIGAGVVVRNNVPPHSLVTSNSECKRIKEQ